MYVFACRQYENNNGVRTIILLLMHMSFFLERQNEIIITIQHMHAQYIIITLAHVGGGYSTLFVSVNTKFTFISKSKEAAWLRLGNLSGSLQVQEKNVWFYNHCNTIVLCKHNVKFYSCKIVLQLYYSMCVFSWQ